MYLLNINILCLKRWCSGLRFAVVHKQSRVRDQQNSSFSFFFFFFFFTFFLNLILFNFEMVLILHVSVLPNFYALMLHISKTE